MAKDYKGNLTGQQIDALPSKIGNLSNLQTTEKSSLVGAINEVAQGSGGGSCNVTINVTSSVSGVSVSGLNLRMIVDDNISGAQTLVTNSSGEATATVAMGSKFEIIFPHVTGCEDITAITRYAVKSAITINAIYSAMATHYELLSLHILKWTGNQSQNYTNCAVHITIDGTTTDYTTGSDGRFEHEIPFGTEYTLSVDNVEGLYIYGHTNSWTYTAGAAHREKIINYHDVEVGIFICANDGAEYTKEEWIASGRAGADAVMVKIANAELAATSATAPNGNIFGIDLDDVVNATYNNYKLMWAGSNVQFTSCAMTQSSDGFDRTLNIVNEGIERAIPTPAAIYCYGKQFDLGGTTLNGFLGATRQHLAVVNNEALLNEILALVRPDATNTFSTMIGVTKWTIDQYNASNAYYCNRTVNISSKGYTFAVVPFYAF